MSNTIKAAILALKSRIADAYTAISNKGGTLPATQDSANLATAIASIPSGVSLLIDKIEFTATADLATTKGFYDAIIEPYLAQNENYLYWAVIENSTNGGYSSRAMLVQKKYNLDNMFPILTENTPTGGFAIQNGYRGASIPYGISIISSGYDYHNGIGDKITLYIYKPSFDYLDRSVFQ